MGSDATKSEGCCRKDYRTQQSSKGLFGSYVTGKMNANSDLDVLVVESEVENPRKESVRIRRALKGVLMPMDILVVQENELEEMADTPGLVYREALRNGKVVYESAG